MCANRCQYSVPIFDCTIEQNTPTLGIRPQRAGSRAPSRMWYAQRGNPLTTPAVHCIRRGCSDPRLDWLAGTCCRPASRLDPNILPVIHSIDVPGLGSGCPLHCRDRRTVKTGPRGPGRSLQLGEWLPAYCRAPCCVSPSWTASSVPAPFGATEWTGFACETAGDQATNCGIGGWQAPGACSCHGWIRQHQESGNGRQRSRRACVEKTRVTIGPICIACTSCAPIPDHTDHQPLPNKSAP